MKKFIKEFKDFAVKGNALDLAVAVIIGGAFGKIVSSLVADIIMPPLGLVMGGADFTDWRWVLKRSADGNPAVTMNTGVFLQNVIDFLIIALVIFLLIKGIALLKESVKQEKKPEAPAAAPLTRDQELLTEIRDLIKNDRKES